MHKEAELQQLGQGMSVIKCTSPMSRHCALGNQAAEGIKIPLGKELHRTM